jgi:hypothetical protein
MAFELDLDNEASIELTASQIIKQNIFFKLLNYLKE